MRRKVILEAKEQELFEKVWFDRNQSLTEQGATATWTPETLAKAAAAAERIKGAYGKDNLGPYTDFEWGVLMGRLMMLRWVLGNEDEFCGDS